MRHSRNIQTSRRHFLGAATTGGLALLAPGCKFWSAHTPAPDTGSIDAHVHIWSPDLVRYPLASGHTKSDMPRPSYTSEEFCADARPAGVTRVVLVQMTFYGFDNSYMLDAIKAQPGTFSGVAVIDENGDDPAREMRRLKGLGVRGFRILPSSAWQPSSGMHAMWKCGGEEGLAMCPLMNPDAIPKVDQMCKQYPDTPVVVDHFARIGVDGAFRENDVANLCALSRYPLTHVKASAFYALGSRKAPYTDVGPLIFRVLDAFGPERVMWASDNPYQVQAPHTYNASIELIRDRLKLSDSDKEWLLRRTAEKAFFAS